MLPDSIPNLIKIPIKGQIAPIYLNFVYCVFHGDIIDNHETDL